MPPAKKMKFSLPRGQKTLTSMQFPTGLSSEIESSPEEGDTANVRNADAEMNNDETSKSAEKRKFQSSWLKLWPWMIYESEKMFCTICKERGKDNIFTQGCGTFKTSSLNRHENSQDHRDSIQAQSLSKEMNVAVAKMMTDHDSALIKAIKTVHWLAIENLPLSKFESMMDFLKDVGTPNLNFLQVGNRIDYQSYYSANEFLHAISDVIEEKTTENLQKSPFVTIYADESTDICNKKRMTMTARIINPENSRAQTVFLRDIEYENGTGEGLTSEIIKELNLRHISISKVLGFGSDGASVMTGLDKGVSGRLKELNPHILNIHCMAHRLALCTAQAAEGIPALKRYQEFMTKLFYYFKVSADREKEVHKVQALLDHPMLKYKEIHAVRWLSFYDGLETIYKTLDPLLTYLHNREAKKDPKAKGLLKQMATTQFIYITYLMMDVLPIVMRLCLTFQKDDLDIARAKISVDSCLSELEAFKEGKTFHTTFVEQFASDITEVDDHPEFKGHRIHKVPGANFQSLKSQFINSLVSNIRKRFPQKSLMDAFYVLSMRAINFSDVETYGIEEINELLDYYGTSKCHKSAISQPVLCAEKVRNQWMLAKQIVKSARYPTDQMQELWELLTKHHKEELNELIKLAQIALTLPLHTASCERVFSQQNIILTKQRNSLAPKISDRLLRVRLNKQETINYEDVLKRWNSLKKRIISAQ
ncbi:zinc finger protein 862-like [Saccostrea cucullata]|uniref:zinc finger protein 862-like n=1 Tax=Saccostrea cuccullata TaxID=36930 RepID=UPI002ED26B07